MQDSPKKYDNKNVVFLIDVSKSIFLDPSALGKLNDVMRCAFDKLLEQYLIPIRSIHFWVIDGHGNVAPSNVMGIDIRKSKGKWIDIGQSNFEQINIDCVSISNSILKILRKDALFVFLTDVFSMQLPEAYCSYLKCDRHTVIISDPLQGKIIGSSPLKHVLGDNKKIHFSSDTLMQAIDRFVNS